MGDMDGSQRSVAQSLAAAQAARNSYNQPAQPNFGAPNNGVDTAVEIERRRGHMQGENDEQTCTITLYPYYFRTILGILRIVQVAIGIIVIATANAEQCVRDMQCGSPSSPMWYGELGGQGFVLFVGIVFILGNLALIFYHLLTRPSSLSTSTAENIRFAELIYDAVAVVLYIIAASVEAWYASWTMIQIRVGSASAIEQGSVLNPYRPQWIASTVFAWINVLLYVADAVYMYFFDEEAPSVSSASPR